MEEEVEKGKREKEEDGRRGKYQGPQFIPYWMEVGLQPWNPSTHSRREHLQ
jgi:hypothetical protein